MQKGLKGLMGTTDTGSAWKPRAGERAGDEPPAADAEGRRAGDRPAGSRRGRLLWAAVIVVAAVPLYVAFLRISWTYNVNSDGAGIALQGWDMLHGNLLLRGWWTADVSFYTFEVPVDALAEAVRGLGISAVHITAAIAYTLLVAAAALLARGNARRGAGVAAAVIAAGILLGAPGDIMSTSVLLGSPDHIGAAVPMLLAFLLVDRARERWWVAPATGAVLIWAQLDDPMAEFAAAFALAVVCLGRAGLGLVRGRSAGAGRADGWSAIRHDALIGAAAVLSYLLTRLATHVIEATGGFSMRLLSNATKVQPLPQWPRQLGNAGRNVAILFGADFWDEPRTAVHISTFVHLAGLVIAVAGLVAGVVAVLRRGDRITQTLTVGTLVTLVAGALLTPMAAGYDAHEIAVVLPFAAVLGGRAAGPWLMRRSRLGRLALIPAGGVLLAADLAFLGFFAAQPPLNPPTRVTVLDRWLEAHHLTDGIGTYWAGSDSRLESGGRVRISPADPAPNPARPYPWIMRRSWFDPGRNTANFVVAGTDPAAGLVFAESAVRRSFGKPARVYRFADFAIMVYDRNLLRDMSKPVQPNADNGGLHL